MSLAQQIDSDLKDAMRAKDATKLGVLRMLKSALKYAAIEKSGAEGELDEAEATAVIRKQVKQRQDSIESFEKGGRAELAEKEKSELAILNSYLPAAMSADDIAAARSGNDRGSRRHLARADGRGHESARFQSRRARRRQNAQPGSAAAVGMSKTSNVQRRTSNVERRGGCERLFSDLDVGCSTLDVRRFSLRLSGRFSC